MKYPAALTYLCDEGFGKIFFDGLWNKILKEFVLQMRNRSNGDRF